MCKIQNLGLQLFVPIALVGCGVLVPLHALSSGISTSDSKDSVSASRFMHLTLTNVPDGSHLIW